MDEEDFVPEPTEPRLVRLSVIGNCYDARISKFGMSRDLTVKYGGYYGGHGRWMLKMGREMGDVAVT